MRSLLIVVSIFIFLIGVILFYFGGFNILVLASSDDSIDRPEYLIGGESELSGDQYEFFRLSQKEKERIGSRNEETKESVLFFPQTDQMAPESDVDSWQGLPPRKNGKAIEIILSNQRLLAWENGVLLGNFLASTGKASTATKQGEFEVRTKLPMAYGSGDGNTWAMPYWLGIYVAGSTENGIHGLPYINGYKESAASLGTPVSHGCIRVADVNQEWLYSWAELGTPVYISWEPKYQ
jgi:hypothetical protein